MYPLNPGSLVSVHTSCTTILGRSENKEIRTTVQESYELAKQIKAARQVGHKCALQAIWVLVTRCVHSHSLSNI